MRIYILTISLLATFFANCQTKKINPLLISTMGVDSIKIGMSEPDVEKVIRAKLKPYTISRTKSGNRDSTMSNNACKDCSEYFRCDYKGVEFLLTFFRFTIYQKSNFELASISSISKGSVLQTKAGIKVGMGEKEFIEICKRHKYQFNFMTIDSNSKGCFFSDNLDTASSKMLVLNISNNAITSLGVVNMIGD